jgi:hypothetical protein
VADETVASRRGEDSASIASCEMRFFGWKLHVKTGGDCRSGGCWRLRGTTCGLVKGRHLVPSHSRALSRHDLTAMDACMRWFL